MHSLIEAPAWKTSFQRVAHLNIRVLRFLDMMLEGNRSELFTTLFPCVPRDKPVNPSLWLKKESDTNPVRSNISRTIYKHRGGPVKRMRNRNLVDVTFVSYSFAIQFLLTSIYQSSRGLNIHDTSTYQVYMTLFQLMLVYSPSFRLLGSTKSSCTSFHWNIRIIWLGARNQAPLKRISTRTNP